MVFYEDLNIKLLKDDVLKTKEVRNSSVDLIITSPPYNVELNYINSDDNISYEDYLKFTEEWLIKCFDWLKSSGRGCFNIPFLNNKGRREAFYADFIQIAKNIGYKHNTSIIWNKNTISKITAWGSWLSATAPYVNPHIETIVVLYKDNWKRNGKERESTINKKEFIEWTNGLWSFKTESKKRVGHPAPFHREFPKRCIRLFSFVGDTVLDPFLGSGTTLIECLLNNRKGIGIEIDDSYCKIALERITEANRKEKSKLF